MAHLDIRLPNGSTQHVALEKDSYVIGRDADCDIAINSEKLAKRHARIYLEGGCHWVEDLGSTSGVFLDDSPVGGAKKLPPDGRITVGDLKIVYVEDDAKRGLTFVLTGQSAPYKGQTFLLIPRGELAVGRGADCAVCLPDKSLSRRHAILSVSANAVSVKDLDSSNGTFVNDTRVSQRALVAGDKVRFGSITCELSVRGRSTASLTSARAQRRGVRLGLLAVVVAALLGVGLQPKLRHQILRLLGYTHSAETLYARSLQDLLEKAQKAVQQEAWADAAAAFRGVLEQDPVNAQALQGLNDTEINRVAQTRLAKAETSLSKEDALEALAAASTIEAKSPYGKRATQISTKARQMLQEQTLTRARAACLSGDWYGCRLQAVRHRTLQNDVPEIQALLLEAEEGLRQRGVAMPAAAPKLAALYGDPQARQVAMRYATGDLETALKRGRALNGGRVVLARLSEFAQAQSAADDAVAAKNPKKAIAAWDRALKADAALLPQDYPSAPRRAVQEHVTQELLDQGEAAFARGQYRQAFNAWQRGLAYDPAHAAIKASLQKLESRAQSILDHFVTVKTLDKEACGQLQDIVLITPPTSALHRKAQDTFRACK